MMIQRRRFNWLASFALIALAPFTGCVTENSENGVVDGDVAAQVDQIAQSASINTSDAGGGAANPPTQNPSQTPAPQPPAVPPAVLTADAGSDQAAEDGQSVTLTARATDSAAAPITFSWRQVSGTPVTLAGATSASATFASPDTSGELTFEVTATAGGRTATDTVAVMVKAVPVLLIANFDGGSVVTFRKPAALGGNVPPRTALTGPNVRLSTPTDVVLDKRGSLIVTNVDTQRLSGFSGGLTRSGDLSPDRLVTNPDARLNYPDALAYDAAADRLFVANFDDFPGAVTVYADASSPTFSGSIAPATRFSSYSLRNPRSIRLVGSDLYAANAGNWNVTVYAGASGLTGEVAASRTITCQALTSLIDIWIDKQDRLYALDGAAKSILVFNGASTLDGEAVPAATISLSGSLSPTGLAIDADGTGYVTDYVRNALFVIQTIGNRDGIVVPDRTIEGPDTLLRGPWHMSVVER